MGKTIPSDDDVRYAALRTLEEYKGRSFTLNQIRGYINGELKKGSAKATPAQVLAVIAKLASRRDVIFDGTHVKFEGRR